MIYLFSCQGQPAEPEEFDVALVAVLSDGGLRSPRGGVQCWDDGSSRITVIRSKTDPKPPWWVSSVHRSQQ